MLHILLMNCRHDLVPLLWEKEHVIVCFKDFEDEPTPKNHERKSLQQKQSWLGYLIVVVWYTPTMSHKVIQNNKFQFWSIWWRTTSQKVTTMYIVESLKLHSTALCCQRSGCLPCREKCWNNDTPLLQPSLNSQRLFCTFRSKENLKITFFELMLRVQRLWRWFWRFSQIMDLNTTSRSCRCAGRILLLYTWWLLRRCKVELCKIKVSQPYCPSLWNSPRTSITIN